MTATAPVVQHTMYAGICAICHGFYPGGAYIAVYQDGRTVHVGCQPVGEQR